MNRLAHHLGSVALERGNLAAARRWFRRQVQARIEEQAFAHPLSPLADFAELAAAEGRPARALRLAGALDAFGSAAGVALQPTERRLLDRWLARARAALPADAAAAAWQAGQDLTPEEALAMALDAGDDCPPSAADGLSGRRPAGDAPPHRAPSSL